ncbi:MAG: hypothetical protein ACI8S6_005749 [Myxococcota bacterium]|jgi:hypothetical protein
MAVDDKLIADLRQLGLSENNYRTLALLPLIHVAWADGRMQEAEASEIKLIAQDMGLVTGKRGEDLLSSWLSVAPSDAELRLGMGVLEELARRTEGTGASLDASTLQDLIALCDRVASSAGRLFGLRDPVSASEREAIALVAEKLSIDTGRSWVELVESLGQT